MSAAASPVPPGHDLVSACCPVCGGPQWTVLAEHPGTVFVRCGDCGLAYRRSHAPHGVAESAPVPTCSADASPRYRRRAWRRLSKSRHQILDLLNHCDPGQLLDVGCSLGYTLLAARQLGLPATGVDILPAAVNHCRALGLRAELGRLDHLPFADGEFGLIILKHVLEHTPRPKDALREVHRVLRPGGGIFVAVPYGGHVKARMNPRQHRFFTASDPFGHYVFYEPETLERLLAMTGFRTVRVHPHLVHHRSGTIVRLLQTMAAPFRLAGQGFLNVTGLRKEFWLCAIRAD